MSTGALLRRRDAEASPRVTNIELFLDLLYVFAITRLSEFLYAHRSLRGVVGAGGRWR